MVCSYRSVAIVLCMLTQLGAFFHGTAPILRRVKLEPSWKWLHQTDGRQQVQVPAFRHSKDEDTVSQRMVLNPWKVVKSVVDLSNDFIKHLAGEMNGNERAEVAQTKADENVRLEERKNGEGLPPTENEEVQLSSTGALPAAAASVQELRESGSEQKRERKSMKRSAFLRSNNEGTQSTQSSASVAQQQSSMLTICADAPENDTGKAGELARTMTFTYPSGDKYEGQMANGKRHGQGTFTDAAGRVQQGEWREGKLYNGYGTMFLPNSKDVFSGTWVNGLREGHGSSVSRKGDKFVGEYHNSYKHGTGTMIYADGAVYSGEWAHGKRNGQGTLTDAEGRVLQGEWRGGKLFNGNGALRIRTTKQVFTGTWVNGLREGHGSEESPDGFKYVGEYQHGLKHGAGTMSYPDKSVYSGEWVHNMAQGQGTLTKVSGEVWTGEWREGMKYAERVSVGAPLQQNTSSGSVEMVSASCTYARTPDLDLTQQQEMTSQVPGMIICIYSSGDKYEGQMVAGKRHGQGTQTYTEGQVLHGEWRVGRMYNGHGTMVIPITKQMFTGTWVNGAMEGPGSEESADGFKYVGEFLQGLKHGTGTMIYPDGTVHSGAWAHGKTHGQGTLTDVQGRVLQGEWKEGKICNVNGTLFIPTTKQVFTGTWVNGMREGHGSDEYPGGYHYVGEYHHGLMHGKGKLVYASGAVHIGEWAHGKAHGPGMECDKEGRVAEGEWREGKMYNGHGTLFITSTKNIYTGTWVNGLMEGHGSEVCADGFEYVGEYLHGKRHGTGTLTYPDGKTRSGEWAHGKPIVAIQSKEGTQSTQSGASVAQQSSVLNICADATENDAGKAGELARTMTFTYPSGDKYEGQMANGKQHGQGTFTDAAGRVQQGEWRKGKLYNGYGTMFLPNSKNVFSGTWVNGLREGHGSFVSSDGDKYVGEFYNNMRHGTGTMIYADGAVYSGEWAHGSSHGQGTLTDAEGRVLQGEWRGGKLFNVNGALRIPTSKQVFTGTWVNGLREGHGSEESPDGFKYVGEYAHGLKHGRGTLTYPDESVYSGEWAHNTVHGQGTLTKASGEVWTGEWEEGKLYVEQNTRCGSVEIASASGTDARTPDVALTQQQPLDVQQEKTSELPGMTIHFDSLNYI